MIDLTTRPDFISKLQSAVNIIKLSCSLGSEAMWAIADHRVQILCLSDAEMDDLGGERTSAFYAASSTDGRFLGIRQSTLDQPQLTFRLLKNVAHEGIHGLQDQRFPSAFAAATNTLNPNCIRNNVAFEIEAYAGTVEIILNLGIHEAHAAARTTKVPSNLHRTSVIRDWLEDSPQEAGVCLHAFSGAFSRTGLKEAAMDATREAAVLNFRTHHETSYIETALQRMRGHGGDIRAALKRWQTLGHG